MDADFWHEKWAQRDIAFHEALPNDLLLKHLAALQLPVGSRLFLPLCGKTLDIGWLLQQGYRVAGAELSAVAIAELFSELGLSPAVKASGKLKHYQAGNIDIFEGDILELDADLLGRVDAVYDRAALVALPPATRTRYTDHVRQITASAPQLLITFDYDQTVMAGPPHAVPEAEVRQHYGQYYGLQLLDTREVPGGLKGRAPAAEQVWLLQPEVPVHLSQEKLELGAFSLSLAVSDIEASKQFYTRLGFRVFGGNQQQNWLIMKNGPHVIGLFQGMFEQNIMTFNPGWNSEAEAVAGFTDIRQLQQALKDRGIKLLSEVDENGSGPGSFMLVDPDGNTILVDQHI